MNSRPLRPTPPDAPAAPPALMRAVVIDGPCSPSGMRESELPVPTPVLSELLVRVVAAGVNPIDAKTRAGRGVSAAISEHPAVLGFDFSGVVVSSPFEAHPLTPGTEVFGMVPFPRSGGTYAEYVVVPSQSVARKPASLSHVEAAGVPLAALTAWGLVVETAHAHVGQRILIHAGSGGVGHFAVQLAAYFGAHVTVTASQANAAWLRELGASVVVDYATTPFEDVVGEMDAVIDLIGNTVADTGTRSSESSVREGSTSWCRPAGGPTSRRPRRRRASARRATRSSPTATCSRPSAGSSTAVRSRSTSTRCTTLATRPRRMSPWRAATRAARSSSASGKTDGAPGRVTRRRGRLSRRRPE